MVHIGLQSKAWAKAKNVKSLLASMARSWNWPNMIPLVSHAKQGFPGMQMAHTNSNQEEPSDLVKTNLGAGRRQKKRLDRETALRWFAKRMEGHGEQTAPLYTGWWGPQGEQ